MKLEIRILTLILCAALMLTTACKKTPIPTEEPQPSVVDFRASSQATWVKNTTTETTTDFPDFGVWGIGRSIYGSTIYNLWNTTGLVQVTKNDETSLYEPATDAYWASGYVYNFLAVAPFDVDNPAPEFKTAPSVTLASGNNDDRLIFSYDISAKYNSSNQDYSTFDLLGAGIKTTRVLGGGTNTQELVFWHLFSQISVDISFATGINGRISEISFSPIPTTRYTINSVGENPSIPPTIISNPIAPTDQIPKPIIIFNEDIYESDTDLVASAGPINIVPQRASDLTLKVNFTISEGSESVAYEGMILNLSVPNKLEEYQANTKYNYDITIGTKASITFKVNVTDWKDEEPKDIDIK